MSWSNRRPMVETLRRDFEVNRLSASIPGPGDRVTYIGDRGQYAGRRGTCRALVRFGSSVVLLVDWDLPGMPERMGTDEVKRIYGRA